MNSFFQLLAFSLDPQLKRAMPQPGSVVDWPAGTPGKIPVGRTAGAGDILAARAASTLNKLTNLREACS